MPDMPKPEKDRKQHQITSVISNKVSLLTTRKVTWFIISVDSVCLFVCMSLSLCQTITFESLDNRKFIFAHPVYLQAIRVKFVYEGHRVKVKVTEATNVQSA